ncbi:MAG: nucleoside-diphosphate sugar epimerase/dehydratase [Thermodesulfobacteriota bacterium]
MIDRQPAVQGPFAGLVTALAASSYYTKRGILVVLDTLVLAFALWLAATLRLESWWPVLWERYAWLLAAVPLLSVPVFIRLGLYRAVIRYASLDALGVVSKATLASFFILVALLLISGAEAFPRSVPLLYGALAFLAVGGSRLAFRILYARLATRRGAGRRVLIYGAGSSGAQVWHAMQLSAEFVPVCFVDDDRNLQGRRIAEGRIYPPAQIPELLDRYRVDLVLLAMPSAPRKRIREILSGLEPLPVEVKTLPHLDVLVGKDIGLGHIQDIQIEDLLGRDPVPPRMDLIRSCIAGKSVLVTGAGGSIGSELCRQVAAEGPARLLLFERSELALYTIEAELRGRYGTSLEMVPILGSVRRQRRLRAVFEAFRVDTVYHAAAYKHVPLVEYNPIEGVQNNLFGTLATAQTALETGVETFVLISTDKAVRPTNVMGATKRMAELICQALAAEGGGRTRFTMVRFGNVLGSSGSVVPLFREQIRRGGPVTVTHPEVVRYFMTIPEAVQLVLQAGAMGQGGDVFVLEMGEPVRIIDLARKMIRLCGLTVREEGRPDGDIAIELTGLRPGEKLYEELLVGDNVIGTDHPMIMRAEERSLPWQELGQLLGRLDGACREFDQEQVRAILQAAVDGYTPQCGIMDPVWLAGWRRALAAASEPPAVAH